MQNGLKNAVNVPFETAKLSYEAIKIAKTVVEYGNPNSITDVGVGAQMAFSGVIGGIYNVLINLGQIDDEDFVVKMKSDCAELKEKASKLLDEISHFVDSKIS